MPSWSVDRQRRHHDALIDIVAVGDEDELSRRWALESRQEAGVEQVLMVRHPGDAGQRGRALVIEAPLDAETHRLEIDARRHHAEERPCIETALTATARVARQAALAARPPRPAARRASAASSVGRSRHRLPPKLPVPALVVPRGVEVVGPHGGRGHRANGFQERVVVEEIPEREELR